ncbi:MAG: hydrogenase maturation protease [Actinomycetota bacterium]|nr:hydrogenase maturation protease [Actinomycetota bacterium]
MTEPRVVGMGNILYRDEGVGVYAAKCMAECFTFDPDVEVVDGGLAGFGLMEMIGEEGPVIVMDAVATEAEPGSIFRLDSRILGDLGPSMRPTAHEVDPVHLFKLSAGLGTPIDMVLIGIVPGDALSFELGLTPELEARFEEFVLAGVNELARLGVKATQIRRIEISEIVRSLSEVPR